MRIKRDPGAFRTHREYSRSKDHEKRLPPVTYGEVIGQYLEMIRIQSENASRAARRAALEASLADLYRKAAEAAVGGIIKSGIDYNDEIERVRAQIRQLGH